MSRRGNCRDTTSVQSFFGLLNGSRMSRVIYPTQDDACAAAFDDIQMLYSPNAAAVLTATDRL